MQPIYQGREEHIAAKEIIHFTYSVPEELMIEIDRKLKAFNNGHTIVFHPIKIELIKTN